MQVEDVSILGTAAFRSASNASELIDELEAILTYPVEVIDGHREALLISKGVLALMTEPSGSQLIMDIGGGSVEFILINEGNLVEHASLPIGVALLHHHFHLADPITNHQRLEMERHIDAHLEVISEWMPNQRLDQLIGAAGIYEVLAEMPVDESQTRLSPILRDRLETLRDALAILPLTERERYPGIPPERADLIVSALILINRVIERLQPRAVLVSPYAMKEGRLMEMDEGTVHSSS